jgi:hypothetical protein
MKNNKYTRSCKRCNELYKTVHKQSNICPDCKLIRTNYNNKLVKIFDNNDKIIGWIPKNKLRNYYSIDVV